MDDTPRNTSVVAQCLGKLTSEAGELLAVVGRAAGFGIDTTDAYAANGQPISAVEAMEREAGHIMASLDLACAHGLLDPEHIQSYRREMLERLTLSDKRDYLGRPIAPPVPPGMVRLMQYGTSFVEFARRLGAVERRAG